MFYRAMSQVKEMIFMGVFFGFSTSISLPNFFMPQLFLFCCLVMNWIGSVSELENKQGAIQRFICAARKSFFLIRFGKAKSKFALVNSWLGKLVIHEVTQPDNESNSRDFSSFRALEYFGKLYYEKCFHAQSGNNKSDVICILKYERKCYS
jgi:hypothetical protein